MASADFAGPRVTFREWTPDLLPAFMAIATHPLVVETLRDDEQPTAEAIEQSLDLWRTTTPRNRYEFAIMVGGQAVGTCGLARVGIPGRHAQLGYALHPDHWGRGLATEAAALLLDFGFGELGLHRIEADTVGLPASDRVLEKIGMRREGVSRRSAWVRGAWHDQNNFAVLAGDAR
ncbi:hypothetical protein Lfu02_06290 [Longispora fulva]|uniref:RimJ/RimL family protein N-acetyltransferase n=1 Tax=Longispora fulva TaxID=619741 RepID=A0A8J7GGA2_9ACTN|nr:GNAT family protein [Longispora fulva]MBG6135503.1 RimJ/RimL family protein N-acetyltransferase [Longispora fulva]GIG56257.1 hypothetical protein Lfu02_06290 [Longispora fulva]